MFIGLKLIKFCQFRLVSFAQTEKKQQCNVEAIQVLKNRKYTITGGPGIKRNNFNNKVPFVSPLQVYPLFLHPPPA